MPQPEPPAKGLETAPPHIRVSARVLAARFRLVHPRFVISRGTALTAIATFATCAVACSSSSSRQAVAYDYPSLPGEDTTVVPPIEPPFYVVPPIVVAPTRDASTSDSGDASITDAEIGVDAQASDAALDGGTGDTGADAPAGDASPLELDAAADAPLDSDR
jgi:hypothetical protein